MNLAIANRSRVSCAHDTLRASIGIKIAIGTPDEPTAPAVSWYKYKYKYNKNL